MKTRVTWRGRRPLYGALSVGAAAALIPVAASVATAGTVTATFRS